MAHTLPIGAHLVTPRFGYLHHGLYAGNGRVIHYAGLFRVFRRGVVEEITLERFMRGHGVLVKPRAAPRFPGAVCVARARSRLGERRYRIWSNNCEHFSEWCITGTSRSVQVEAWKTRLGKPLKAIDHLVSAWRRLRFPTRISSEICIAASETGK